MAHALPHFVLFQFPQNRLGGVEGTDVNLVFHGTGEQVMQQREFGLHLEHIGDVALFLQFLALHLRVELQQPIAISPALSVEQAFNGRFRKLGRAHQILHLPDVQHVLDNVGVLLGCCGTHSALSSVFASSAVGSYRSFMNSSRALVMS